MLSKLLSSENKKISEIVEQMRKNWRDIYWWKLNIHQLYFRLKGNKRAIRVTDEDWDNLIILDACRYDLAKSILGDIVDYRYSLGSSTDEFLIKNFANSKFYDIVYVTANPFVDKLVKKSFYRVISVWKLEWDEKINTVHPKAVFKYALLAEKKYPDKRLIIHFIQPHIPFIKDPELTNYDFYKRFKEIEKRNIISSIKTPWTEARRGNLDIKRVWRAYKRNLEVVLPYAIELAKRLKGKTVITSDHGNAFKRLLFPVPIIISGHPSGIYIPDLIKVPWIVFEKNTQKKIRVGEKCYKEKIKRIAKKIALTKMKKSIPLSELR